MITLYDQIRGVVMNLLSARQMNGENLTTAMVTEHTDVVLQMHVALAPPEALAKIDRVALIRDLESSVNVYVANPGLMKTDEDHAPWLEAERDNIDWHFWNRYKTYLSSISRMAPEPIKRLDEITDMVLGRLEDPKRRGSWDQRGLVAGQVQSGKTGNYIGLICKAMDANYKLIVVLAGVHNSLRAQTQVRIDEGVLGFNTERTYRFDKSASGRVGVGLLAGQFLHANSFTSRKESGDFSQLVANQVGVNVGGHDPVVLVVKKNKSILTNLLAWSTSIAGVVDPETGKRVVRDVPLLVIDDEADQASVDTNGPKRGADPNEYSPTVINELVRKLLDRFEQSAYVGYTATPFANIFIDPDVEHKDVGRGLFPRSFIISLPAPSNYVGPARVFGLMEDVSRNIESVKPLPMLRTVDDNDLWLEDKHKKDALPGPMPESLKRAMLTFVLTCAVRKYRGHSGKHNSMLVHVTRFTDVQRQVRDQVLEELERIQHHIGLGDHASDPVWLAAEDLYRSDFVKTTKKFMGFEELNDQVGVLPSWKQLRVHLIDVVDTIETRLINGKARDALEYVDRPSGINVIVIGGAKLSRGLTLEGLSVSYYLRASRMYDTLMQMGRWFGYRPGYLDLCRLYTTAELTRWYELISEASEELYQEFDYMVALGSTPREFGLRVRQHPDGLMVTSPNRMRGAKAVTLSFAGNLSETVLFRTDGKSRKGNLTALRGLVSSLKSTASAQQLRSARSGGSNHVWKDVPADLILRFLDGYQTHEDAYKVQPKALRDYIASRNSDSPPELNSWWVVLASASGSQRVTVDVAGTEVGLTRRAWHPGQGARPEDSSQMGRYPIRRLVSPPHERIDFPSTSHEYQEALTTTKKVWASSPRKRSKEKEPTEPAGIVCRGLRPPSRGVLVLYVLDPVEAFKYQESPETPFVGFALSFPTSENAKPMQYQVTMDAWRQLLGTAPDFWSDDYDDGDDDDGDGE